jgi:hypothetical protein
MLPPMQVPVFINCRDRVTCLKELVAWLERAGAEEIYLLDNDSAYEPLLAYFEETSHTVVRLGQNYGPFALWSAPDVFALTRGRSFAYTDPDIVPADECPADAFERFTELLQRYPAVYKAGYGLKIDDLPDHYAHKQAVRAWEGQHWRWAVEPGAYLSAIDTTFALYRPGGQVRPADAIRTGPPYVARHTPWYLDLDDLSEDEVFYQERGGGARHWNGSELPEWLSSAVEGLNSQRPSFVSRTILEARMYRRLHWTVRGRRLIPRR